MIQLRAGDRELGHIDLRRYRRGGVLDRRALRRAVIAALPLAEIVARGRARITYRIDRIRTATRALRQASSGGSVQIERNPIAAYIQAPVIAQELHNNCESTALSILLATTGLSVSQLRLQAELPRSGPLDPTGAGGATRIWGDPARGFVGRADGGGVAGGFGVYQEPIASVASRHGRHLADLTGRPAQDIYARLLAGRPVMVWVGLSAGPYGDWRSPQGRQIHVNFGEHAVVLNGIDPTGDLSVIDPLDGTLERWSRSEFEAAWKLLGRRALAA